MSNGAPAHGLPALGVSPRRANSRWLRSELKTILRNPESRKIFYFLVLNISYMLIQMLYGVWTNSLGLISDAIHMAFDCMAIAVGLFASVMATWPPNERFTYGFGRIETLSGFANGIFLILISIFIVFEAIQRLLEPPEMNTGQLLLVSTVGLAVNLFGMFATGGHHHHGHSHSHSGHSHTGHDHHGHSHKGHDDHDHSHTRCGDHDHSHADHSDHGHSHSHPQSCAHAHSPTDDTSHSHNHEAHAHTHFNSPASLSSSIPPYSHSNSSDIRGTNSRHLNGNGGKPTFRGPFLKLDTSPGDLLSPMTPSYRFGHDDHFQTHHTSDHAPNLHDHSHSHGGSHEGHSHNIRGVFLHVMADTLGSVGVIISTLLIQFYGWTGFDPIASLFIAVLIAASVIPLVVDTGRVLALDVADRGTGIQQALSELTSIHGLASYNSARFWPKDESCLIGSIHIRLAPLSPPSESNINGPDSTKGTPYAKLDQVVERVDALLRSRISGLEELTIQVESS